MGCQKFQTNYCLFEAKAKVYSFIFFVLDTVATMGVKGKNIMLQNLIFDSESWYKTLFIFFIPVYIFKVKLVKPIL